MKTRLMTQKTELITRFNALQPREKYAVAAGAIGLLLFLCYSLLLSPLFTSIDHLREQIRQERRLSHRIDQKLQQIQSIYKNAAQTKKPVTTQMIQQSGLGSSLTHILLANNTVRCSFDHVDFDAWITELIQVVQKNRLRIVEVKIEKINNTGIVDAEVVLA